MAPEGGTATCRGVGTSSGHVHPSGSHRVRAQSSPSILAAKQMLTLPWSTAADSRRFSGYSCSFSAFSPCQGSWLALLSLCHCQSPCEEAQPPAQEMGQLELSQVRLGPLLLCSQGKEKCWWRMVLPIKLSGINSSQHVPASQLGTEGAWAPSESHLGNGFPY